MSGKKVFTNAGEKLAEFLINKKQSDIESANFTSILETINSSTPTVEQQFLRISTMSKEEVISYFTEQVRLFLNNLNITNGEKDVHLLEITQELFNNVKYQEITSLAQFEAINSFLGTKLADIVKSIGSLNRLYRIGDTRLNGLIADLLNKPLEYFRGSSTDDLSKIYYRFDRNALNVANGKSSGQLFHEVMRVSSVSDATNPGSFVIGDVIHLGLDTQFTKIYLEKPTTVKGNLTLDGGELIGTAIKSRYGDIAEYYSADKEYTAGTLLMVDTESNREATINNNLAPLIGVVSHKPGFILNEELKDDVLIDDNNVPIYNENLDLNISKYILPMVLTGKTPVKVHSLPIAQGRINKGDILFPSMEIPGVAVAVPFNDSYQFEIDIKRKPIGIALSASFPKLLRDDSINAYKDVQLIYSKIN